MIYRHQNLCRAIERIVCSRLDRRHGGGAGATRCATAQARRSALLAERHVRVVAGEAARICRRRTFVVRVRRLRGAA